MRTKEEIRIYKSEWAKRNRATPNGYLHARWRKIISRITDPKQGYVQQGITICPEWRHDFVAFKEWALGNGFEPGLQIDRIDSRGNYEPSNCRWVNSIIQVYNRSVTTTDINGKWRVCSKCRGRKSLTIENFKMYPSLANRRFPFAHTCSACEEAARTRSARTTLTERICKHCSTWFALNSDNFHKDSGNKTGLSFSCKKCAKERSRLHHLSKKV